MRRWISFGLVVLVACVAAANLTRPRRVGVRFARVLHDGTYPHTQAAQHTCAAGKRERADQYSGIRADPYACGRQPDQDCDSGAAD